MGCEPGEVDAIRFCVVCMKLFAVCCIDAGLLNLLVTLVGPCEKLP